jgi:hypothetical protein
MVTTELLKGTEYAPLSPLDKAECVAAQTLKLGSHLRIQLQVDPESTYGMVKFDVDSLVDRIGIVEHKTVIELISQFRKKHKDTNKADPKASLSLIERYGVPPIYGSFPPPDENKESSPKEKCLSPPTSPASPTPSPTNSVEPQDLKAQRNLPIEEQQSRENEERTFHESIQTLDFSQMSEGY